MNCPHTLLVDGKNLAYRARFAFPDLTGPDGQSTSVIYGFLQQLERTLVAHPADQCVVCWDSGLAPFRVKLLPTYKQRRAALTEVADRADQARQIEALRQLLPLLGVGCVHLEQPTEADDLIAAGIVLLDTPRVTVVSTDKDFLPLVDEQVQVLRARKTGDELVTATNFADVTGFATPTQYLHARCLQGDMATDKIPGVGKIGKVGAAKYVAGCGDSVISLIALLTEDQTTKFYRNLALMSLWTGVVHLDKDQVFDAYRTANAVGWDWAAARQEMRRYGFASMLMKWEEWTAPFRKLVPIGIT